MKNLRRREVEIFGAKRVVRNDFKKDESKKTEEEKPRAKRSKKKTEGK
jgi:hypothetical protein